MCFNFNAAASQANIIDSSEKINNKKEVKNKNSQENNEDISASTLKSSDNVEVENQYKDSGMAATSISFEEKEVNNNPLQSKIRVNDEDITIGEFISSMNDKTMKAILDSFDKMLQSSRKMMEENKRFIKEVKIPQEQIQQKELNKELIQEDFMKKQMLENNV